LLALPAFFVISGEHTLPLGGYPVWLHLLRPCHVSGLLVRMVITARCSARHSPIETAILGPPRNPDRKAVVKSSLSLPSQSASFLAASSLHSGSWIFVLPITSCSLRLDDDVMRTTVTLIVGLPLCVPHPCRCGSLVDAHRLHSFVCKRAPGKLARHHAVNDLISRAFVSAGILVTKEPQGLSQFDVNSMAGRQSSDMGRHGRQPTSRIICPYGSVGHRRGS